MLFEKWQALGNDYLLVEQPQLAVTLTADNVQALCNRHTGVGADGVIELRPASDGGFVAELRIFNADGSEAELSGNGVRQAVLYLSRHGWTRDRQFSVVTKAGPIKTTILSPTSCSLIMGRACVEDLGVQHHGLSGVHLRIGNPQTSLRLPSVAELETLVLHTLGPEVENDPRYSTRINVSFWAPTHEKTSRIRARIWERGVGETASSGTGACGAAVAHKLRGGRTPVTVILDGGELTVDIDDDLMVTLTGQAVAVFSGELPPLPGPFG